MTGPGSAQRRRPHARPAGARSPLPPWAPLAAAAAAVVVVAIAVIIAAQSPGTGSNGRGTGSPASGTAAEAPNATPAPAGSPLPGGASGAPAAAPPTPAATALAPVPIVPAVQYRAATTTVGPIDVAARLAPGAASGSLELVADQANAILAALGTSRAAAGRHLVLAPDAATLMADLAAHRDRLAFMRADQVGPGVRAVAWRGTELFGVHRLKDLAKWRLKAELPATLPGVPAYDPAATWTLWAAGDIGMDRTVYKVTTIDGLGVDYPYNGGTARISGTTCCSAFGWKLPVIVGTGHAGAMRDLISSADLALANMEESAPNKFVFHPSGTAFTGDPKLLAGVARSGVDIVGCASTHIADGGRLGVLQTMANLTGTTSSTRAADPTSRLRSSRPS